MRLAFGAAPRGGVLEQKSGHEAFQIFRSLRLACAGPRAFGCQLLSGAVGRRR